MAKRPSAEDFLELVERARRGRLKLYLGFAAGVGKTYRMLEDAHALKARGVDVVLAFIEPHDRPETIALVKGLEQVPRKKIAYRGIEIEEMDVEAVIARKPQVAVVDELAHTNVPGSKNRKRYQDVIDLLAAGINVLGAFNIQHLESLNDLVERTTRVRVRETIPDRFLRESDQIVSLDLAVDDLVERLRAGKIYAAEKVPWALEHFFTEENLLTLRELALREVAESLDRSATQQRPSEDAREGSLRRVMVCLSSNPPHAKALLRRGSRMAGRLSSDWFVVYVETPSESPTHIDSEAQRHLLANLDTARELGAEVIRLKARDPVAALLDFARSHNVGHLIVGSSTARFWRRALRRTVPHRMIDEAGAIDVHVVSFGAAAEEDDA